MARRRPLVAITDERHGRIDEELAVLDAAGAELVVAGKDLGIEEALARADALLVNLYPMDAAAIDRLGSCKAISRYGIGLDNIDVAAAAARGIAVCSVPDYCIDETAEHALALLLDCARGVSERDRALRAGGWNLPFEAERVAGSVLGVLGFGPIGAAFAGKALGLGFRSVLVHSRSISRPRLEGALGAKAAAFGTVLEPVDIEGLFARSDYISIHLRLCPDTRALVSARLIASMKRRAILVNVSRGALVDEAALAAALLEGRIAGAGLDVFEREPLPMDSPLRRAPGLVLTDHAAYASRGSLSELKRRAAENLLPYLGGRFSVASVRDGERGEP